MELTVIVVTFNSGKDILNCLRSLDHIEYDRLANIIVVDNNSHDDTIQIINENFNKKIEIVSLKSNVGFGRAINIANKRVITEGILIINPDAYLVDGGVNSVLNKFDEDEEIACIAANIIDEKGEPQITYGYFPNIRTDLLSCLPNKFRTSNLGYKPLGVKGIPNDYDYDYVSGACMVIRKPIFDLVKGFDERFFLYYEDADLCLSLKKHGKVEIDKEFKLTHICGQSSMDNNIEWKFDIFEKSKYLFLRKHNNYFEMLSFKCISIFRSILLLIVMRDKKYLSFIKSTWEA